MAHLHPSDTSVPSDARVLVLLAHPALHRSRVNRALYDGLAGLPGVTRHDLYDAYPDHDVDVGREQALLDRHDVVVWLHPFYWYAAPSLLKEWQDLVLEWGWAYGPGGDHLRGKTLLVAVSTGGPLAAYQPDGNNRYTVPQLLAPAELTARLCGMRYLDPFVTYGSHRLDNHALGEATRALRARVTALRDAASPRPVH